MPDNTPALSVAFTAQFPTKSDQRKGPVLLGNGWTDGLQMLNDGVLQRRQSLSHDPIHIQSLKQGHA